MAAVISLELVLTVRVGWRSLFWTASRSASSAPACARCCPRAGSSSRPASPPIAWRRLRGAEGARLATRDGAMSKKHWALCVYAVLLPGFNFLSLGSQARRLRETKGFNPHTANDYWELGRYLRRRLRRVDLAVLGAAEYDCRLHTPHRGLHPEQLQRPSRGGRALCSLACRARGVLSPSTLAEIVPPAFRATSPALRTNSATWYSACPRRLRLVNVVAPPALPSRLLIVYLPFPFRIRTPEDDDQGHGGARLLKVQGTLIGVVAVFVLIIGPENHGSHLEKRRAAFDEGGRRVDRRRRGALPDGARGA
ncbi:hypothetical protein B0H14DRAFT_1185139 [Mycena olivaceomarginata]|nr:hypothetical protein B0H14DRAFT_1185139 [Mycena olivaceomarginata]